MTGSSRVGDLIRVVGLLRPDASELRRIAELLPHEPLGPTDLHAVRHRIPLGSTPPVTGPAAGAQAGWAPTPLRPAHRRTWLGVARSRAHPHGLDPSLVSRIGSALAATAAILLLVMVVLGRLPAVTGLVVIAILLRAGQIVRFFRRQWSAWRHSVQVQSTVEHHSPPELTGGEPDARDAGSRALTLRLHRTGWTKPPASAPLVREEQRRGVATLLASRLAPGEIDLVATVRQLASRRALTAVPTRPRWRTNRGMELHIDVGPALEPFRSDVEQLRAALVSVAAAHAVTELGFSGDPRELTRPRRLVGPRGRLPLAHRLPLSGTPVLVLTDLGIAIPRKGKPADPEAFLEHHQLLVRAGCPVHYLVPYPKSRWPAAVRDLPIVHWADELGTAEVLAAVRPRPRVPQ